jgi:dTDP-4-amino-4,6-dideoxygalactose transaminase
VLQPSGCKSNYYKYRLALDPDVDRDAFKTALREHGVAPSGEVYAQPLHMQPVFADVTHGPLPAAEYVCAHHVCLPVHSDMTLDEAARVVDGVRAVLSGNDARRRGRSPA